ncbi:hypothetical protein like AT5G15190 [Hibiscus trionum]|uniref:Uncharacterized protein n=1 Tax=Hibiscus trionum TaxID=183268 RepID=A0A9W7IMD1_HIBTR|nr:hypothetical protein like AT5G15190 [Hibiscus trionum]
MDVVSGESSTEETELESPRSVVLQMKKKVERLVLHTQVLRIREEDSHLGDAVGGDFSENITGRRRINVVLVSKPILPSSPLSGKNSVKKGHAMQ